jgi:hypothetical protein
LQLTAQDGQLWVGNGQHSVEITPICLKAALSSARS